MIERRPTLDEDARRLHEAARRACDEHYARGRRWTLMVGLSWRYCVSEAKATGDLEVWANRLTKRVNGVAIYYGLHNDTDRLHALGLIYVPKGMAPSNPPPCPWLPECSRTWHQHMWPHGSIWLDRYSYGKARDGRTALYVAKDPGSVRAHGRAPAL